MPDTGLAAGQIQEYPFQLLQKGAALSYANKTAFEAAGWAADLRVAQADQTFTYTLAPHSDATLAAEGWHVITADAVNGQGFLMVSLPTTGTGWQVSPQGYITAHESVDLDEIHSQLVQGAGVNLSTAGTVSSDFSIAEGQSFTASVVCNRSALTAFGFDVDDLTDGTLALSGMVRASDNAEGIPNAYLAVSVVSNDPGENPTLRISIPEYPLAAVASVIEGMALSSGDSDPGRKTFFYDVDADGTATVAISGVATGAGGTFTTSGDNRRWFAIGMTVTVSGSTGNDGDYTVAGVSYNGTNTVITVASGDTIADGTADGTLDIDVSMTLIRGALTVTRQETRATS